MNKYSFGQSTTARQILKQRYLLKDNEGKVSETIDQSVDRVVACVGANESAEIQNQFRDMIMQGAFCPNSPTLMNAGKEQGQLAACFVLPIEDDIRGIFETLKNAAWIQQSGGGTGFSFGHLRPEGELVQSSSGPASGPVGFLKVFDQATEAIKQGGARRGANMGILPVTHPNIESFIHCKSEEGTIRNFNISVGVTSEFMTAVENNQTFQLVDPRTGNTVKQINANVLFNAICTAAWKNGEPGIVFLDRINEDNPTPELGPIESTNPCGEQPLLPYEACNLGSINLAALVDPKKKTLDWNRFAELIQLGVRFLDDVIDTNTYPLDAIAEVVQKNRKIGLGLMGLADTFIHLDMAYDSEEALALAEKIATFFADKAKEASEALAKERGPYPQWEKGEKKHEKRRNATVTTVAPTGTISLLVGCSPGIEPNFSFVTERNILDGNTVADVHPLFENHLKEKNIPLKEILDWLKKNPETTTLNNCPLIPENKVWTTATGIDWKVHVKMQALFQEKVDNGVSKTINLPETATVEDVAQAYTQAWNSRLKGITVYRHRSRSVQSQSVPKDIHEDCGTPLVAQEGCLFCPTCLVTLC